MFNNRAYCLLFAFSLFLLNGFGETPAYAAMRLESPAFASGTRIPVKFTCSGENGSPALIWSGVPASAKSLALIISDPDAPSGNFIHWVIFDIPPAVTALPYGVRPDSKTSFGATQGQNSRDSIGYTGPCPPPGQDHHYHFRLYALDRKIGLASDADADQVEAAIRGHIVAAAELVGIFAR